MTGQIGSDFFGKISALLALLLLLTLFLGCSRKDKSKDQVVLGINGIKPVNILFVFTDDQRWDALGYAGNSVIRTPNLDSLANQGTYFDNAFVTTPIYCVSRASVLTGQYGKSNGVLDFFTPINLETTYPKYLHDGGYYAGFIGKWVTMETDSSYFMKSADLFDFCKARDMATTNTSSLIATM